MSLPLFFIGAPSAFTTTINGRRRWNSVDAIPLPVHGRLHHRGSRYTAARMSIAEADPSGNASSSADSDGTTEEVDKRLPPPPPPPAEPMDYSLGEQTGVVTADVSGIDKHADWRSSLLASRNLLPNGHPFTAEREAAESAVAQLPAPGRKQESWRFTDLRPVYESRYIGLRVNLEKELGQLDIRALASERAGAVLVFVDGIFRGEMSLLDDISCVRLTEQGGYVGGLDRYSGDTERVVKMFERTCEREEKGQGLFSALNAASARDAAIVHVPKDYAVEKPIVVLFVTSGGDSKEHTSACATRLAVIAECGCNVELLEQHVSLDGEMFSHALTLASSAVDVEENAKVSHYFVNALGKDAQIIASTGSEVRRAGVYELRSLALGAALSRHTVEINLGESEARGVLHGATVANGSRIADLHSRIVHDAENTTSDQLQKNIAADRARTVFNGKIIVTKNGDQTDSAQLCRSLLISDKAKVDAMPVLEIATDDVKCTHGATVTDLEPDELFYCQSRGLTLQQSRTLIIKGFASEILNECPFPSIEKFVNPLVEAVSIQSMKAAPSTAREIQPASI